jgi:signal transduction histidine kinase
LYCDKDQLIQVFLNLIMNAIQHVSEQGHIIIYSQIENGFLECKGCDEGAGVPDVQKPADV